MKKISKQKIADIYATALIDEAGCEHNVEELYAQVQKFTALLQEDTNIINYFASPLFKTSEKLDTLEKINKKIKFLPLLYRFLQLIIENNRFSQIDDILETFVKIHMNNNGYIYVVVQSVKELSKKQNMDLQKNLQNVLSKKVIIKYEIKPEILGGLVILYDGNIIDDSLKNKISIIEKAMKGA